MGTDTDRPVGLGGPEFAELEAARPAVELTH